jgi:predicted PurR-regulated permease PerM
MSIFSNWTRRNIRNEAEVEVKEQPFYLQATVIMVGLVVLFYILSLLQDIFIPLAFALLLSILLNPMTNWFISKRIRKEIAIILSLLVAFTILAGVFVFVSLQLAEFTEMLPTLRQKFDVIYQDTQHWISRNLGYSIYKQDLMVKKVLDNSEGLVGSTLTSIVGIVSMVVLIPIYIYLILYYKRLLLNFVYESFDDENGDKVEQVLAKTKGAVQSYVSGLLIETLLVAVLNSVALLILGVDYAIMLGAIGALLNLVPYIGGIIAIALPVLMALITKDGYTTPLLIVGAYSVIQFIDNNLIVPKVVSSKVSVNALVSIVIVLLGNALWGVSGMFLSIPFIGVLKIIFDQIDELNPWGKLLGTKMPTKYDPVSERSHTIEEIVEEAVDEAVDENAKNLKTEIKEKVAEKIEDATENKPLNS